MFPLPSPGRPSRRDALRAAAATASAFSLSGWLPVLAAEAAKQKARAKACIVLWMDGGPPHTDTFDLKPDVAECGIYKPIPTAVPGIQISELLPKFAAAICTVAPCGSVPLGVQIVTTTFVS